MRVQLVMGVVVNFEFGTMTSAFSSVRTLVERRLMSSTVPSTSGVLTQSPISKGRSVTSTRPPKKLLTISCPASANERPPRPRPASTPLML